MKLEDIKPLWDYNIDSVIRSLDESHEDIKQIIELEKALQEVSHPFHCCGPVSSSVSL